MRAQPTREPRAAAIPVAPSRGGSLTPLALALLGFGLAIFADQIASCYLLQRATMACLLTTLLAAAFNRAPALPARVPR